MKKNKSFFEKILSFFKPEPKLKQNENLKNVCQQKKEKKEKDFFKCC